MTAMHTCAHTSIRVVSLAALMACAMPIAQAADWPTFKPGHWTFARTMTGEGAAPERVSTSECAVAYTITVDSVVDGDKTHEVLRARRTGDCAK